MYFEISVSLAALLLCSLYACILNLLPCPLSFCMSTFNWFRINNKCGFWLANRFADSIPSPFLTPDSFKKESKHAPLFLQLSAHGYLHRAQRWPAYFGWENYYLLLHFHLEHFNCFIISHSVTDRSNLYREISFWGWNLTKLSIIIM